MVVGHAPTVDVGSSSTGRNVPSSSPAESRGPPEREGRPPIVRSGSGDHARRTMRYLRRLDQGATSPENRYVLDGMAINTPNLGVVGTPLSMEFVKEMNVISGGYMPEYGRSTGGIMNVVTKSGSNEFHGSAFGNITPGGLEGNRRVVRRNGTTISNEPSLSYKGDLGFELGGPIVKDKTLVLCGRSTSRGRASTCVATLNRPGHRRYGIPVVGADGFTQTEMLPGTEQNYRTPTPRTSRSLARSTYAINRDNQLTLEATPIPIPRAATANTASIRSRDSPRSAQNFLRRRSRSTAPTAPSPTSTREARRTSWPSGRRPSTTSAFSGTRPVGWFHGSGGRTPADGSAIGGPAARLRFPTSGGRAATPSPTSRRPESRPVRRAAASRTVAR